jgi:hypothetical protein
MTMKIEKTLSQRVRDANNENNEPRRGNKIVVRKNTTGPGMKATTAIDNPGLEEISLNVLYERLRLQEVQLSEDAFKWLQVQFANQRFFSYPIFDPPHDFSDKSRESLSDPGVKYNFLLLLLRTCRTREDRLFMLATWLHLEGICPPEDLLGEDFSQYRRKAPPGSRGRLSQTYARHLSSILGSPTSNGCYSHNAMGSTCGSWDLTRVRFRARRANVALSPPQARTCVAA